MFFDLEDALLLAIIILGTAGAALLLLLKARVKPGQRGKRAGVYALVFVWVYVISDVAEHLNRMLNPLDGHGTGFARAFLLIGLALVVYLRISDRGPVPARVRDRGKQEEGQV